MSFLAAKLCRFVAVRTIAYVAVCLLLGARLVGCTVCAADEGILTWNNNDALSGELIGYESDYVRWKSDQFSEPLEIHSDFIASVKLNEPKPANTSSSSEEEFRFETLIGDVFFGRLLSIDEKSMSVQSNRLGRLTLMRENVRELRQLKHTKVFYDGPRWLDGWRTLRAVRLISEWEATEHGHLKTSKYNGELYRDLPTMELMEINLVVRWSGKPGMQIDFSTPAELIAPGARPRLSVKSWGADVVATTSIGGTDFQQLLKLDDQQKELRLRIVWDNKAGEAVISGVGGKEFGRVSVEKLTKGFGVLLKNRSPDDLIIEQIRLSKWNGASNSEDRETGKSYVRLADGKLITQQIKSLEGDEVQLANGEIVSLGDIAVAELNSTAKTEFTEHRLRFYDGTELSGKIVSVDKETITMEVRSTEELVVAQRDGIDSIRCFQGRTNEFEFHLVGNGNRLSGNLRPVQGSGVLGWAPIGCKTPVPINVSTEQMIERRMGQPDNARPLGTEVVYLKDDSVLHGNVKDISKEGFTFKTEYTEEMTIPTSEVRATEMLDGSGRVSFTHPDWSFTREGRPLQRTQERLEICDPISMRHPNLGHNGRVSFSCSWDDEFSGLLSVHMGSNDKQPRSSLVRFTFSQNRVTARSLINAANSQSLPLFSERRANISLDANNGRLVVWVNGIKVFSTKTKRQIEAKGLWLQGGSARNALGRNSGEATKPRLVVDRLRIGEGAGRMGTGFAAHSSLEMMLKLPRNRTEDAPECILCATNGDLLRGELIGLNSSKVTFKSRYEEVSLPRDEVSGIVWLQGVDAEDTTASASDSLRVTLRDGSNVFVKEPTVDDEMLIGKHDLLTSCRIPLEQILKLQNSSDGVASASGAVTWSLEKTPEPKFVDDGAGDGLDSLLIGQVVSDIEIPMLEGESIRLGDENKVVILDFWASWCAPCIRSLPRLVNLAESFPKDKVRLIAVNEEEKPFAIEGFLSNRDLEVEVGLDEDASLAKKFGVTTIPQTIIVGPDGKIAGHFVGAPADLHEKIMQSVQNLLPSTD